MSVDGQFGHPGYGLSRRTQASPVAFVNFVPFETQKSLPEYLLHRLDIYLNLVNKNFTIYPKHLTILAETPLRSAENRHRMQTPSRILIF